MDYLFILTGHITKDKFLTRRPMDKVYFNLRIWFIKANSKIINHMVEDKKNQKKGKYIKEPLKIVKKMGLEN
jgi:hypothetical protein